MPNFLEDNEKIVSTVERKEKGFLKKRIHVKILSTDPERNDIDIYLLFHKKMMSYSLKA